MVKHIINLAIEPQEDMLAGGSLCYGYIMDTCLMSLLLCGSCPVKEGASSYQNKSNEKRLCRYED